MKQSEAKSSKVNVRTRVVGLRRSECLVPYVGMPTRPSKGTRAFPLDQPPGCVGFCARCAYILFDYHLVDANACKLPNGCFVCVSEEDCLVERRNIEKQVARGVVYFFPERQAHIDAMIARGEWAEGGTLVTLTLTLTS